MPIDLPEPPLGGIPLPHQPADPPTLNDVKEAREYYNRVRMSHETQTVNSATEDDVARAAVYESAVVVAHAGGAAAPAWFVPALNQVLTPLLTPIKQVLFKSYNMQCGNGLERPYEIVPFNDGTMPPHELPALRNTANIRALTGQQATRYAVGYGLGEVNPLAQRRKAIGRFIGSIATV